MIQGVILKEKNKKLLQLTNNFNFLRENVSFLKCPLENETEELNKKE